MRFDKCPKCEGKRVHGLLLDWPDKYTPKNAPCDFCQDDNGNPTGRVCVVGDVELQLLHDLYIHKIVEKEGAGEWTPTENIIAMRIDIALDAELTHRKEGGGG